MKYGLTEKEINTIIEHISKYNEINEAILFGSRAINTYKKASDIDIAIKGKNVTPFTAAKLKMELEDETVIPYFFDIISLEQITHKEFIEHITSKGIVIYKK